MSTATTDTTMAASLPMSKRTGVWSYIQGHGVWMASLFLVALAGKFWLLARFGTELPYWDAWKAEAHDLYVPYFQGHLSWSDLFRPHNEHRMFFPKLYCLGLLVINGQWDNQFQNVMNAFIHSATLTVLGCGFAGLLGKRFWPLIWPPMALALAVPFAWENTFGGGLYTQFYFLLAFSLVMLWFMCLRPAFSRGWWLGVMAGIGTLLTTGSGFLTAAAVGAIAFLEFLRQPRQWRDSVPTLVVCGVFVVAGVLLKVNIPGPHPDKTHSIAQFVGALARNLAWPCTDQPWCALINLFPLGVLGWMYFRSTGFRPAEKLILGLGLWVLLQAVAVSYARGAQYSVGNEGSPPASRYMDTCSFIVIANALAIGLLVTRYRQRLRHPPAWYAGFLVWFVVCMAGLWATTESVWYETLPLWLTSRSTRIENTRAFLATDDPQVYLATQWGFRLSPDVGMLTQALREPSIRHVLPEKVREPLTILQGTTGAAFVPNGLPTDVTPPPWDKSWGSFSGNGAETTGEFESLPIHKPAWPFLSISVSGDLGADGLSLELIDLVSGKSTAVRPRRTSGADWRDIYVRAPAHAFKVVAKDQSRTGWFAFKEPREMARFSYWAAGLLKTWTYLLIAAFACLVWSGTRMWKHLGTRAIRGTAIRPDRQPIIGANPR